MKAFFHYHISLSHSFPFYESFVNDWFFGIPYGFWCVLFRVNYQVIFHVSFKWLAYIKVIVRLRLYNTYSPLARRLNSLPASTRFLVNDFPIQFCQLQHNIFSPFWTLPIIAFQLKSHFAFSNKSRLLLLCFLTS